MAQLSVQKWVWMVCTTLVLAAAMWAGMHWASPKVAQYFHSALGSSVQAENVRLGWYRFAPALRAQNVHVPSANGFALSADQVWITFDLFDSLKTHHVVLDTLRLGRVSLTMQLTKNKQALPTMDRWQAFFGGVLQYVHRLEIDALVWQGDVPALPWQKMVGIKGYVLGQKALLEGGLEGQESHVDLLLAWHQPSGQVWEMERWTVQYQGEWQGKWLKPLRNTLNGMAVLGDVDGDGQFSLNVVYGAASGVDVVLSGHMNTLAFKAQKRTWTFKDLAGQLMGHGQPGLMQWSAQDLGFVFNGQSFDRMQIDWQHKDGVHDEIRINQLPLAGFYAALKHSGYTLQKTIPMDQVQGWLDHVVVNVPSGLLSHKGSFADLWGKVGVQATLNQVHLLAKPYRLGPINGEFKREGDALTLALQPGLALLVQSSSEPDQMAELKTPLLFSFNDKKQTFSWQKVRIAMPSANAELHGFGKLPNRFHIKGSFSSSDLAKWVQSWPSVGRTSLQQWLKESIGAGSVTDGQVDVYSTKGKMGGFIKGQVQGGQLNYAKDWPGLLGLEGQLVIDGSKGLHWQGSGQMCETKNIIFSVDIPGFLDPKLLIKAKGQVQPHQWFDCFNKTPLSTYFEPLQSVIDIKGRSPLSLEVQLPLFKSSVHTLRYKGSIDLAGLTLDLRHGPWAWNRMSGQLFFDQNRIWGNPLKGYWQGQDFDVPLTFDVSTLAIQDQASEIIVDFQWRDTWDAMMKRWPILHDWFKDRLYGKSLFHGRYVFDYSGKWHRFEVQSGLIGTRIHMPWGKVKQASDLMPLRWKLFPRKGVEGGFEGSVRVGSFLQAKYQTGMDHVLDRLRLHFGKTLPSGWLAERGIELSGHIPSFSFDPKTSSHWQQDTKQPFAFDLTFGHLSFLGFHEPDVHIDGSYETNHTSVAWQSPRLKGTYVFGVKGIELGVDYFHFVKKDKEIFSKIWQWFSGQKHTKEVTWPLSLRLENLQWGSDRLEHLSLEGVYQSGKLLAKHIHIEDAANFEGSLAWHTEKPNTFLRLDGRLSSKDFGAFAEKWLQSSSFDAGDGEIDVALVLPKPEMSNWPYRLQGSIDMDCKNGHFKEFSKTLEDKLNLGRWLGALSFQSLGKRMSLDFSDLVEQGYHTDRITGTLRFANGHISTTNLKVLGSELSLWLKGHIDINQHTGEVQVKVQAPVTSSLPLLATMTAGPAAGIVTWVADKLILKHVPGLSIHHYRLVGKKDGSIEVHKEEVAT